MMKQEDAIMLAKYSYWADLVLFDAMKQLPDGAIYENRKTLFGSMIGALNHNYVVDLIWRAHLLQQEHGFSTRRDVLYPNFDDLILEQSKINQWYIDWIEQQTSESFNEYLHFKFVSGQSASMTRGQMFLHIVNHKTYHRGWVCQMFFDYDINPPETDLCVFLCEK